MTAQFVSRFGDNFTLVAIPFAVLAAHGTAASIGLVMAARLVPQVLFLLLGGVFGDHFSPVRIMVISSCVRGATQLSMAWLAITGHGGVWSLAALFAVYGAAAAFFQPASRGLIPKILSPDRIQSGNAIASLADTSATILGPACAGGLIAISSPGYAFGLDGVSFLFGALLLASMRIPRKEPAGRPLVATLVRQGWGEVSQRRWLVVGLLHASIFQVTVLGSLTVLGPAIAAQRYGGASTWGLFLSLSAVGSLVGGAFALHLDATRPLVPAYLALLTAVTPLIVLGLRLPFWVPCLAMLVYGAGLVYGDTVWESTLQRTVPVTSISRVAAFDGLVSTALRPVGLALAGPVAVLIGTASTLLASAVIATVATLSILSISSVRTLSVTPENDSDARVPDPEMATGEP